MLRSRHALRLSAKRRTRKQDERVRGVVVSLAPKKRLFLNVRRKRLLVSPFGKSFAISTNGTIRSELSRLLTLHDFLPEHSMPRPLSYDKSEMSHEN